MRDGAAGIAYERRIAQVVNRLEEVTVPTVAAVRGYCMGGGLALAAVCDLRVATRSARFGVPIARTLGNCLSVNSVSVLVGQLGPARTLDLLLRARSLTGEEAAAAGFVAELCDDDALDADAGRGRRHPARARAAHDRRVQGCGHPAPSRRAARRPDRRGPGRRAPSAATTSGAPWPASASSAPAVWRGV